MKKIKFLASVLVLWTLSIHAVAQEYTPWPEDIPTPTLELSDDSNRFRVSVRINPQRGSQDQLKQYNIGVVAIDPSGFDTPKEVPAGQYYETYNYFKAIVEGLFPHTTYVFKPYIIYNGEKCLANVSFTTSTSAIYREGQWGDYSQTQTTITLKTPPQGIRVEIKEGDNYVEIPAEGYTIENLDPRPWFSSYYGDKDGIERSFRVTIGDKYKDFVETLYTARITLNLDCTSSPTGLLLQPSCVNTDADIQALKLISSIEEKTITHNYSNAIWYGGLVPNRSFAFRLVAVVKSKATGKEYLYPLRKYVKVGQYTESLEFKTTDLSFGEVDMQGVTASSSIATVTTNINNRETGVGFQWKKYDAPATLKPTEGSAVIYNGKLECKIKNLQNQYYDIRPFYKDNDGDYYYGSWITFDPSDFSYIEPTVHTYAPWNITENQADVKGYILEGSDEIIEQGFEYVATEEPNKSIRVQALAESPRIVATGQIMTAKLENLKPDTTYSLRAYAITTKGEIFGEEVSFTTKQSAEGYVTNIFDTKPVIIAYYTLSGHKLDSPQPGLNIVVYSDGTIKKIMVR